MNHPPSQMSLYALKCSSITSQCIKEYIFKTTRILGLLLLLLLLLLPTDLPTCCTDRGCGHCGGSSFLDEVVWTRISTTRTQRIPLISKRKTREWRQGEQCSRFIIVCSQYSSHLFVVIPPAAHTLRVPPVRRARRRWLDLLIGNSSKKFQLEFGIGNVSAQYLVSKKCSRAEGEVK